MKDKEAPAADLIQQLESTGLHAEASQLRETQNELNALARPPGLVSELTDNLKERARRQWELVLGEVQETAELVELLNRRVLNGEKLTPEEKGRAREQMLDIMKRDGRFRSVSHWMHAYRVEKTVTEVPPDAKGEDAAEPEVKTTVEEACAEDVY